MRIITRKLWRAFPELDGFSDDQCARFVRAAKVGAVGSGGLLSLMLRWMAVGLTVLVISAASFAVIAMIFEWVTNRGLVRNNGMYYLTQTAAGVLISGALLLAFGAGMLVRDALVRRRVRQVIKTRGRCAGCGYVMLGLPVPENLKVTCPECQLETWVDPALAELVTDEAGQRRLKPLPEKRWLPRWMNRRLAWNMAKGGAVLVLVLIVGAAGWWAWNEQQLSSQAKRAQAARVGLTPLQTMVNSYYPAATPENSGEADGWAIFTKLEALRQQALADVTSAPDALKDDTGAVVIPEPTYIFNTPEGHTDEQTRYFEQQTEMGQRAVLRFRALGGEALLNALALAPRAARDWTGMIPPGQPAMNVLLPWLSEARQLARLNMAMMEMAKRDGDLPTYLLSLRATLRLTHMMEREPVLINRLVAIAVESLVYGRLREHLAASEPMPAAWLDAIQRELDAAQLGAVPFSDAIKGEGIMSQDTIAWVFSDAKKVRSRWAMSAALLGTGVGSGRVGTYEDNAAKAREFFEAHAKRSDMPPPQRQSVQIMETTDYALIDVLMPALDRAARGADQVKLERDATKLMLAIERYRAAKGAYPASLESLVPEYIKALPRDDISGQPFAYRLVNPEQDDQKRGYLLYSFGIDGVDNNGKPIPSTPGGSTQPYDVLWSKDKGTGFDFIINDKRR
jgi:hypothetical protein